MSAIASAYRLDDASLAKAVSLMRGNEWSKLWNFMKSYEVETLAYSGYVLAAAIPFVQQKGIVLPKREDLAILSSTDRKTLGLVALGNAVDYAAAAQGLANLSATNDELRQYYEQLYEHEWDQSAVAMREAFSFLERAIKSVKSSQALLLLMIN